MIVEYISKFFKSQFPNAKHKEAFLFGFCYYMSACVLLTLSAKTIGLWLKDLQYSVVYMAFIMSVLHTPNSARIVLAAWLDYVPIKEVFGLGYRKSMMFWCMFLCVFGLLGMAYVTPKMHVLFLLFAAITATLSAMLESLTSAYFNTAYDKEYNPTWIQAGQIGHQIGLLLMNAGALFLSYYISWRWIYASGSVFVLLSMLILPFSPKCSFCRQKRPKSILHVYTKPLESFYYRHKKHLKHLLPFLLFYRTPDQILGPVASFLQIDIFGKRITALLKALAFGGTLLGSFLWKNVSADEYIRLKRIGVLHTFVIVLIGVCVWMYYQFATFALYSLILLYIIGALFIILKIVRTMESAAIFAYQCSLWDIRFFNAQASLGNLMDKLLGEVFAAQAGLAIKLLGWPFFLIGVGFSNLPALWSMKFLRRSNIANDDSQADNQFEKN